MYLPWSAHRLCQVRYVAQCVVVLQTAWGSVPLLWSALLFCVTLPVLVALRRWTRVFWMAQRLPSPPAHPVFGHAADFMSKESECSSFIYIICLKFSCKLILFFNPTRFKFFGVLYFLRKRLTMKIAKFLDHSHDYNINIYSRDFAKSFNTII